MKLDDKLSFGLILYGYAVFLGATYLFAFWRPIGFDAFPYLSIQDYINVPLNRIAVIIIPPVIISALHFMESAIDERNLPNKAQAFILVLFSISFARDAYRSVWLFNEFEFWFRNEATVIAMALGFFVVSWVFWWKASRATKQIPFQLISLLLIQCSSLMASGYCDGKTIFNGAENIHFLDNKEICEKDGVREWVYISKYSDYAFFMNTIDKRICITSDINYKLSSRKFKEKL